LSKTDEAKSKTFTKISNINLIELLINMNIYKCFSIVNREVYKVNKDFAAKLKGNIYQKMIYDRNLLNIMHSLYLIRRNFEKIVFIGQNPEILLANIPSSKFS
jgi:hypothetical protein